jgi:multidrug efflux pump subunit AcrB
VRLARGEGAKDAAVAVVDQSALPLLGATVIAILAFAAIGTSPDSTGEFCRSLYQVVLISLGLSWVTAVGLTPLLCVTFLRPSQEGASAGDEVYDRGFYAAYKRAVRSCIRWRGAVLLGLAGLFLLSLLGFRFVDKSFFPPSTRPQFMVDLWLPAGTHIDTTEAAAERVGAHLRGKPGVTHVTSLVGKGALRFLLTYTPEKQDSSYAQLLVDVDDAARIDALIPEVDRELVDLLPEGMGYASKFELGPGSAGKVQARISGPDRGELRVLAEQAEAIMASDPGAKAIRTDWRGRTKVVEPVLAEEEAEANGIGREEVAQALRQGFDGVRVGVFREADLLLPIVMRAEEAERTDVASLQNLQIWSPAAGAMVPLRQVVSGVETRFEDPFVWRKDRKRTVTVFSDPRSGPASELFARLRPRIEALELPPGYALEWGGEYEDSADAQGPLFAVLPLFVAMMVGVTIVLFDSLRVPLVIWLNVPLALIGVTAGLLLTRQPFGFMALLGFLSLMGMLIKNAIVLIDEINAQRAAGKAPLAALVDSGATRLRPVAMAASTTALGLLPLLVDAFFVSMAVTIIFGLMVGTVLTMVVLPVFYSVFFRVAEGGPAGARGE